MRSSRSASTGWFRLERGWSDDPCFADEAFSARDAYVWLVERAAFRDSEVQFRGQLVTLRRGQLCTSVRQLAEAWGWSAAKVFRWNTSLEKAGKIETVSETVFTLITICNYDGIQGMPATTETVSETVLKHQDRFSETQREESLNELKRSPLTPRTGGEEDLKNVVGVGRPSRGANPRGLGANPRAIGTNPRAAPAPDPEMAEADLEQARRSYWGRSPEWMAQFSVSDRIQCEAWIKTGYWGNARGGPFHGKPPDDPDCRNLDPSLAAAAVAERKRRLERAAAIAAAAAPQPAAVEAPKAEPLSAAAVVPPPAAASGKRKRRPTPAPAPRQTGMLLPLAGGADRQQQAAAGASATPRPPARGPPRHTEPNRRVRGA